MAVAGSTSVESALQIGRFMQNEPNFTRCPNGLKVNTHKGLWQAVLLQDCQKRTQSEANSVQNEANKKPIYRNTENGRTLFDNK